MFTTTHLTTTTTSMTTRLLDYTNRKGLALCGHIILPGCGCTLVGPGQYARDTSAVKDGRPWVAQKHHPRLGADVRLHYFHGSGAGSLKPQIYEAATATELEDKVRYEAIPETDTFKIQPSPTGVPAGSNQRFRRRSTPTTCSK